MKSTTATPTLTTLASLAILGLVPAALAHGDEHMDMGEPTPPLPEDQYAPTYFAHPDHQGAILAHIALMAAAWVLVLPVAVMLSLARSRYTLLTQLVFVATNGAGVLLGVVYNTNTPDLYPNNAHHKLGWIVTWVVGAQVLIGLLGTLAGAMKKRDAQDAHSQERRFFIPVSTEAMEEHNSQFPKSTRFSNDSGQGTEPNTESIRSQSVSSGSASPPIPLRHAQKEYTDEDDEEDLEAHLPAQLGSNRTYRLARKLTGMVSIRTWKVLLFVYNFVDRTILILGFIALCTGIIAYGRFFEGHQIFTGLAHWIKGGIFFWLGLFTLGRWAGSFGDLGWAWNMKPKQLGQRWTPSSEFVESALIFIYGATNIFLEHLGSSGGAWSAQDLEHVSITVLFIGGGLCGMLIESSLVRDLLNTTVSDAAHTFPEHSYFDEEREQLQEPEAYRFSLNPIPALVILLLGIMMSSHTQTDMTSSMVHKQWGNLLTGASFSRAFTYVLTYLKPPKSIFPSRPPTELLTAFGLISGGIIFMISSGDTIDGMNHYGLDAMVTYTVTMGFVGLLMAWELMVIALKGWAVRKESGRPAGSYRTA